MSNADRTTLQIAEEATFGTAPASNYLKSRFTSESLTRETTTTNSATIRPDRNIEDVVRTGCSASLELTSEFDLSTNMELDLMEAAVGAASSSVIVATVVDVNSGSDEFDVLAYNAAPSVGEPTHGIHKTQGNPSLTVGFTAGDWIRIETPDNSASTVGSQAQGGIQGGGYFRILSTTSTALDLEGSKILANATLSNNTLFRTHDLEFQNGVAERSFTVQKSFNDVDSGEGMQGTGMTIDSLSLSVSPESIITKSITFQGQNATHLSGLTGSGAAAPTAEILNAIDHVAGIYAKTGTTGQAARLTPLSGVTSFEINIQNNLRARNQVGSLGPASFGQASINVNGSITVYYDSNASNIIETLYDGFEDGSLAIVFEAAKVNAGSGYVDDTTKNPTPALCIYMPRVKFTGATRNATGTGTDVMAELQFQAFYSPATSTMETLSMRYFL